MATEGDIIEIKEHSKKKYRILKKYLNVCETFSNKYQNFAYIDTHGGSGKVLFDGKLEDGSVLIARNTNLSFPCYVVEINIERFSWLSEFTKELSNIKPFNDDCNKVIDKILDDMTKGEKFILCFLDPDGLIYRHDSFVCHQLLPETVKKIAEFPRTEILLNFPLEAIVRSGGCLPDESTDAKAHQNIENVTNFFGKKCDINCSFMHECKNDAKGECNKWKKIIEKGNSPKKKIRKLLELYISKNLSNFPFVGAILIKNELNVPQYYLVYGTKYFIGAKIMRGIMKKEWGEGQQILGDFEKLFPINKFIFE